jgi:hypothetical protein
MPHAPVTLVRLRPLDELGPQPAPAGRGARARVHLSEAGPEAGRRGTLEMLDLSIGILREHFALLVGLGALSWLPVRALQPFVGDHIWEQSRIAGSLGGWLFGTAANMLGSALAQCFGSALLARIVHAGIEGRSLSIAAALRAVLARLHVVIALALVTALATSAGFCACILPGFLLSWKLAVAPMACVIEGTGMSASLARSFALTRRGWWRWVFLAFTSFVIGLPFAGVAALGDLPGSRAQALAWTGLSGTPFDVCFVVVSSLALGVALALRSAALTVYYADCRVRREGADLEAQLGRLRSAGGTV